MSQGESKRSRLLTAAPLLNQQGVQETYPNKRDQSTMYKFWITFENGDAGEASAKSPDKAYPIGKECTYIKYTRVYQNRTYMSFTKIQDPEAQSNFSRGSSGGGYKKKTPEEQKEIINQVALIATNTIMAKIDEEYDTVYNQFRCWMYDKIFATDPQGKDPISVQGVLKISSEYWKAAAATTVTAQQVTGLAETFYAKIKITTCPQIQNQSSPSYSEQPPMMPEDDLPIGPGPAMSI